MPGKTLGELAALVDGRIEDPAAANLDISGVCSVMDGRADEITFFANKKYINGLRNSKAGAVLVTPDFSDAVSPVLLRVENPSVAFATIAALFAPAPVAYPPGIHPSAVIERGVTLGADVCIQPGVVIQEGAVIGDRTVIGANTFIGTGTRIGNNVLLYPNVTVRERVSIGNRVVIHSGVVVGSDGFGYEMVQGRHVKIPQIGSVQIDDDVEIGANTTIDRARFGRTWIQEGAKIDNLVQIAHNVVIGKHSIVVAQTGIAGSSRLGEYVTLAGQVGLAGHIEIGNRAVVGAQSGISKDIPEGEIWFGSPATTLKESHAGMAQVRRLGKLNERVRRLEEAEKLRQTQG